MAFDMGGGFNPFTAIGGAASIFGLVDTIEGAEAASSAAQKEAGISENIASIQIQENAVRQQAMELSANRQQIEIARQTQLTSARNLATAVGQGAQFSSGATAGTQAPRAEGAFQSQGVNQMRQLGEQMFAFDTNIDQQKILMAQAQSQLATAQGQEAIGGAITNVGMNFMKMFAM